MERFVRMLRSLGAAGALANARAALDERRREDWVVDGLLVCLDRDAPVPAAGDTGSRVAAAS
jgi:hypothetical protein